MLLDSAFSIVRVSPFGRYLRLLWNTARVWVCVHPWPIGTYLGKRSVNQLLQNPLQLLSAPLTALLRSKRSTVALLRLSFTWYLCILECQAGSWPSEVFGTSRWSDGTTSPSPCRSWTSSPMGSCSWARSGWPKAFQGLCIICRSLTIRDAWRIGGQSYSTSHDVMLNAWKKPGAFIGVSSSEDQEKLDQGLEARGFKIGGDAFASAILGCVFECVWYPQASKI